MSSSRFGNLRRVQRTACLAVVAAVASLATTLSAQAAVMTLSFEQLAADGSNVQNTGDLVGSVAYGGSANGPRVINGVDWNILDAGSVTWTNPDFQFINNRNASSTFYSGDAALKATTDDIIYAPTMTLQIHNLVVGQAYRIQFISFDAMEHANASADKAARQQTLSVSNSSSTLDYHAFLNGGGVNNYGGTLIVGSWVADAGSISFTFAHRGDNDNAILNAWALHAVPEPASLAFFSLAGLAALRRPRGSRA